MDNEPLVAVCNLQCDRKRHMRDVCLESMFGQTYENCIFYQNIETAHPAEWCSYLTWWRKGQTRLLNCHHDLWHTSPSWRRDPKFDQDQIRQYNIVTARNMCIMFAQHIHADFLMFVDSDMIIPRNSVEVFLQHFRRRGWWHMGGLVQGRGSHRDNQYIFGKTHEDEDYIYCLHGNIGFSFIARSLFMKCMFRTGFQAGTEKLNADDPNFCSDAIMHHRVGPHALVKSLVPVHVDDPQMPFIPAQPLESV